MTAVELRLRPFGVVDSGVVDSTYLCVNRVKRTSTEPAWCFRDRPICHFSTGALSVRHTTRILRSVQGILNCE